MPGITDGKVMRIKVGGTAIAYATSDSFSKSRATRSRSHKDIPSGYVANDYGEGSWEMSGDALFEDGSSFEDLSDAMDSKTKVTVEMSDSVSGNTKWTGDALVTSLEMGAPDGEDTTFSFTLTGDGATTKGLVA